MTLSWDDIERMRDETFFRTPIHQLHSLGDAERMVNAVGFCFAFKANHSELPCMWHAAAGERNPTYPIHVQNDPFIGLVWEAKDFLATTKKVYYGKAFKKRPSFISLSYFPLFYALMQEQRGDDYIADYMRGGLSREARRIMDALQENSPQITADLKIAAHLSNPEKRRIFDTAISELQSRFYIVKIGEFYDPFTFLWDLVDRRFADEINAKVWQGRSARRKIMEQYFKLLFVSTPMAIQRLFAWQPQQIEETLTELVEEDFITDHIKVEASRPPLYSLSALK